MQRELAIEQAHHDFAVHTRFCMRCSGAGGEWAAPDDLCPQGRALLQVWEHLEGISEEHPELDDRPTQKRVSLS